MITKPQITIIGTEGSGKTILATVWAKRLSSITDGSIILNPLDWKTGEYVEKVWNTLNSGEWWKSTEAGQQFELQWNLHIGSEKYPVKLIDAAGQDLRTMFSNDAYKTGSISYNQQQLLDYIQSSSIVVVVVNLIHFSGEVDALKRKQNEFVLKGVVDMFADDGKHQDIAIVFTAYDRFYLHIQKTYSNFTNYLKQELPLLYNSMYLGHLSGDTHYWFPVSAVADTEKKEKDGKITLFPKKDFRSVGLDEFTKWLVNAVQTERQAKQKKKYDKENEIIAERFNKFFIPLMSGLAGAAVGLTIGLISSTMVLLCVFVCSGAAAAASFALVNVLSRNTETEKPDEDEPEIEDEVITETSKPKNKRQRKHKRKEQIQDYNAAHAGEKAEKTENTGTSVKSISKSVPLDFDD